MIPAAYDADEHFCSQQLTLASSKLLNLERTYEALLLERVEAAVVAIEGAKRTADSSSSGGGCTDLSAAMTMFEEQQRHVSGLQDALTRSIDEVGRLRDYNLTLEQQLLRLAAAASSAQQDKKPCMMCVTVLDAATPCVSCLKCGAQFHPACAGAPAGQKILCPLHRQLPGGSQAPAPRGGGRLRR
jgi:hypothetical protein